MLDEKLIVKENEKLNIATYNTENIKNMIYTIRGKQVMLDSDVAMLYNYETKKINQTVKRNIERFPEKFCFQLTQNETDNLRSQIVTSSLENYGGRTNKYHDRFIVIDNEELYHCRGIIKRFRKEVFWNK